MQTDADSRAVKPAPPVALPVTVKEWLVSMYEKDKEGVLACASMYEEYESFCTNQHIKPSAPPVFGKYIYQLFPEVVTKTKLRRGGSTKRVSHYKGLRRTGSPEPAPPSTQHPQQQHPQPAPIRPPHRPILKRPEPTAPQTQPHPPHTPQLLQHHPPKPQQQQLKPRPSQQPPVQPVKFVPQNATLAETLSVPARSPRLRQTRKRFRPETRFEESEEIEEEQIEFQQETPISDLEVLSAREKEHPNLALAKRRPNPIFSNQKDTYISVEELLNRLIVQSFETTFYHLRLVKDCNHLLENRRYLLAFAQSNWPIMPIPWIIVNGDAADSYVHSKEDPNDGSVLALNLCVTLFIGATVLSEFDKAFEIYKQCMKQVESLHDCVDVNLIPALIYMASFALLIFEPHQGAKLALNYVMVGEATCLALNATNTEVYEKMMNFKFWLTHGEARDVMPRDPDDTLVTESVDQLAAQSLGSDFERIMFVRRKICYSMAQSSYLEKVLTMLKKYKKELAREIPGGKVPREILKSDPKLRRYKEDFLRLHLQAEKVLEIVEPHVHRSCFVIQQIGVYSRLTDAFFELGKKRKAERFALRCLEIMEGQGCMALMMFNEVVKVLVELEHHAGLERFIRIASPFSKLRLYELMKKRASSALPPPIIEIAE